MAHLAREGALQRDQHEKQLATAQETLQTMCTQAEEAAAKLRTHAQQVESEAAARLEAARQQADEEARRREESAGAHKDALGAVLSEIQEKVSATFAEAQNSLREQVAQDGEGAGCGGRGGCSGRGGGDGGHRGGGGSRGVGG